MKHYELLLVLKPTLTEEEAKNTVALIKEVLEKNGAEISNTIEMGTRKLAYVINKHERGTYVVFYFTAPTASISEVERIIRINEEIIRFMTVKFENKKEVSYWEKLSKQIKDEPKPAKKPAIEEAPEEVAKEEAPATEETKEEA